jgi:pyridoxal phosphate enzyme (YggS family)
MNFDALPGNLARVREEIAHIRTREGLASGDVRIVAVTKGHPAAAVRAACVAGLLDIGESRIQEAVQKQDELEHVPVRWHMIGHLQTNKAKFVPGRFVLVHSVDSVRLAEALNRALERHGDAGRLAVLVQINVAGEVHKTGCRPDDADELVQRVRALPRLEVTGLMTMAPFTDDEAAQRQVFARLRGLRDRLETACGVRLADLSMGMSGDYPAAVAEGATIVRLGTVLFGERPQ